MRKPRRSVAKLDVDPLVDLLEALPRVIVRHEGTYTYKDRAADFMAVFNGQSSIEQGRRVLSQIQQICDPTPSIVDADKPGTLAFKAGERRGFYELMNCFVSREPPVVERAPVQKEK